jgi:hypothetical protein
MTVAEAPPTEAPEAKRAPQVRKTVEGLKPHTVRHSLEFTVPAPLTLSTLRSLMAATKKRADTDVVLIDVTYNNTDTLAISVDVAN